MAERRAQLQSLVEPMGILLGATGTHPWADWKQQRIIDTPHYRRNDELLRYVVWRNNTFGLHVHVAIRGADRAIAVLRRDAQLPPGDPRALGELAVRRGRQHRACTPRGRRSSRASSRAAASPTRSRSWAEYERFVRFLYDTGSITEHTQIWWSVRPHLAFPTVEIRIARRAAGPRRGAVARGVRDVARRRASPARTTRARPVEPLPHRLIEENFWRAIRWGLPGELLDFDRGEPIPARQRLEELIEWVLPVAEEIGAAPYLAVPERNAAERQIERFEDGASLEQIYAEQVRRRSGSVADEPATAAGMPTEEELRDALDRVGVADVLLNAVSATASLGFRRVSPEARDLPQARLAIEALRALEPVLKDGGVDEAVVRDLEQARANLQLAYAKAGSEEEHRSWRAEIGVFGGSGLLRAPGRRRGGRGRDAVRPARRRRP